MDSANLSSSDIVAVSSAVIALCALGVALWQGHLTRRHNILSARPLIDILACVGDPKRDGIVLKNCGPGPAIFQAMTITSNRVRYNLFNESEFKKLLAAWSKGLSVEPTFGTLHTDTSTILGSGDEVRLLIVNRHPDMPSLLEHLEGKFDSMELYLEYKCLYGKTYSSKYCRGVLDAV